MEEIHFITPENIKFSVPVSDIYSFCEKYCEEYISKSEENKEKFYFIPIGIFTKSFCGFTSRRVLLAR